MARHAASRLEGADRVEVTDDVEAGVWVRWTITAETDRAGIDRLQEIRLRAEMTSEYAAPGATTPRGDDPTLFQATPLVILRGDATVIHSEEVYCI